MKKKIFGKGASLLNRIAESHSNAPCNGIFYETKVPEQLRRKAVMQQGDKQ